MNPNHPHRRYWLGMLGLLLLAAICYFTVFRPQTPSDASSSNDPAANRLPELPPPPVEFQLPPEILAEFEAQRQAAAANPPPAPPAPPPITNAEAIAARNELRNAWNQFTTFSHDLPRDLYEIRRTEFLEQHRDTIAALTPHGGPRIVFEIDRDIDHRTRAIPPDVHRFRQQRDALLANYNAHLAALQKASTPTAETADSIQQWLATHDAQINEISTAAEPFGEMNFHHKLSRQPSISQPNATTAQTAPTPSSTPVSSPAAPPDAPSATQ